MPGILVGGHLVAQEPGSVRWRVQISGTSTSSGIVSSPALADDGTIYVGNYKWMDPPPIGTNFYSISPSGTTNWIFSAPKGFGSSAAVSPEGVIYIGSLNGTLYALNSNGSTNWIFPTPGQLLATPALAADGTIYIHSVSNRVNSLFALNPSGTKRWGITLGAVMLFAQDLAQFSSPAIGPDGTIYVASVDRRLYAISPAGTTNWMFNLNSLTHSSPTVGADGTVYIGTDTNGVFAVERGGVQKWRFYTGNIVESSAVINNEGNIIIASHSYTYCLSPSGRELWKSGRPLSATPAVAADGSIYIPNIGDRAQASNSSGSYMWSFMSETPQIQFSSPAIAPDGTVYLVVNNYLYAFNGNAPLMESAWPMFRRKPDHRARALQCALSQPAVLSDGSFSLTMNTETGLTYSVQGSTDLSNWTVLTNFVSADFSGHYTEPDTTIFTRRFFRLLTQ